MAKINEIYIKVSGKFPIENQIGLGQEVKVELTAGCVKREEYDNQDGSVDVRFTVKPLTLKVIG